MEQIKNLLDKIRPSASDIALAGILGSVYGCYRWWIADNRHLYLEIKPDDTPVDGLCKHIMNCSIWYLEPPCYVLGGGIIGSLFVTGWPVTFPAYYAYAKRHELRKRFYPQLKLEPEVKPDDE